MRFFLILVLAILASPAAADWQYQPPPIGAVVVYDDGHSSRIAAAEGERIILIDNDGNGTAIDEYRTWLLRTRRADPALSAEIVFEIDRPEEVLSLWPLKDGLSLDYAFSIYENGELSGRGSQALHYMGRETLDLPAGSFETHKLLRDANITRAADGSKLRFSLATWHDAETGLILRQDWFIALSDAAPQSGSFVAVSIELHEQSNRSE